MSSRRRAEAAPDVAAVSASVTVIPSTVAPRPTTSGIAPKPAKVPALASLARATVAPASIERPGGWQVVAQHDRGRRQQRCDRVRRGKGAHPLRIQLLKVVDRCGAEAHAELRGTGSLQLVRVKPHAEARG